MPEEDIIISVSADNVTSASYTPSGTALDPTEYTRLDTVDTMFALVQRAIDSADAVRVVFNAQYGFPELIDIDWILMAIDDEVQYSMSHFSEVENQRPEWLLTLISEILAEQATNPPAQILRYDYNGSTVYYVPASCCDIFSDLYDAGGKLICHPDGGITGTGDGLCRDFISTRTNEVLVWRDTRAAGIP